jgi:23S rRNA (guanosine2251-2'-O)-methyltransferase
MSEIIVGRKPLLELLEKSARVKKIFLRQGIKENRVIQEIKSFAGAKKIVIEQLLPADFDRRFTSRAHQGVAAEVKPYHYYSLDGFLEKLGEKPQPVLVLDGLTDLQNFGSLARSLLAFGGSGIIIRKKRSVKVTPGAFKASAGALEQVKIARVTNLVYALSELKKAGWVVLGTDVRAQSSIFELDLTGQVVLVLGREDKGVSALVKRNCDGLVKIPVERVDSLNVAVAGAIFLYEAYRQRRER